MIYIAPYKMASESARFLQALLKKRGHKCLRIRKPRLGHKGILVNWGKHGKFGKTQLDVLNNPLCVATARNKITCLGILQVHKVSCVPNTIYHKEAKEWQKNGKVVYERHTVTGQEGAGIKVVMPDQKLNENVRLYTQRIPAKEEWRLHVFFDDVITWAKKMKKNGMKGNKFVKNSENGYVYAHKVAEPDDKMKELAKKAVRLMGLDFGAVDILRKGDGTCYVLEVNTAPGLDTATATAYINALERAYENKQAGR